MIRALALLLAAVFLCGVLTACDQISPDKSADDSSGGIVSSTSTTTTTTTLSDENNQEGTSSNKGPSSSTTVRVTTQTTKRHTTTVSVLTSTKTTGGTTVKSTTKPATTTKPSTVKPLSAIDEDDYYGRSKLSGDLRKAYDRIADAVEDVDSSIDLSDLSVPTKDIMRVFQHYCDDYPQHFYLDTSGVSFSYSKDRIYTLKLTYTMSKSEIASAKTKLEKEVKALLNGIHGGMTAYERERLIYSRLINHVTYTISNDRSIYTMYGALVNQKAVCDGYAHALQYLLYRAGIPCIRVTGNSKGEGHAWNMVKLSDKWYHVDATWDDPIIKDVNDFAGYSYFNVTDQQIRQDHTIAPVVNDGVTVSYDLPTATATTYYYFNQTGPTLSSFDYKKVLNHCKSVAEDGGHWAGFKITGSVDTFAKDFLKKYADLKRDMHAAGYTGYFKLSGLKSIESLDGIIYIYIK